MIRKVGKRWGREEWVVNDEYCCKFLHVKKLNSSSIHYHKNKKETFHILKGKVKLEWYPFDDFIKRKKMICSVVLDQGQSFTLYQRTVHRFTGLNHINTILEVSTHHEDDDTYKLREERFTK